MTNTNIKSYEEVGFKRWTKNGMDRLYISAEALGLDYDCYKSGNISSACFKNEAISHRRASEMRYAKIWVDVATGKLSSRNAEDMLIEAAESLIASLPLTKVEE